MINRFLLFYITNSFLCFGVLLGQGSQLQSIEEVISGIDSLLKEIDSASNIAPESTTLAPSVDRPFRAENELMPADLVSDTEPSATIPSNEPPPEPQVATIEKGAAIPSKDVMDFSKLSLSELLNEVDMLQSPDTSSVGGLIDLCLK